MPLLNRENIEWLDKYSSVQTHVNINIVQGKASKDTKNDTGFKRRSRGIILKKSILDLTVYVYYCVHFSFLIEPSCEMVPSSFSLPKHT